jgi:hypothetical protein
MGAENGGECSSAPAALSASLNSTLTQRTSILRSSQAKRYAGYFPVLQIHDILVWIRIRIRGSMPLTNGSGSGSCFFFRHEPRQKFFCLLLFEGTFTSFFKDKKSKRSHKIVGIKVFLLFLLDDRRIWIRLRIRTSD